MKKGNRKWIFLWVIFFIAYFSILAVVISVILGNNTQKILDKTESQITEALDKAKFEWAIQELSELRGRVQEIDFLSYKNIPENILLDELRKITTKSFSQHENPYLKDFALSIFGNLDLRGNCENIISQIDDQIFKIKFGTGDS